jgi:hypothetical protein
MYKYKNSNPFAHKVPMAVQGLADEALHTAGIDLFQFSRLSDSISISSDGSFSGNLAY